MANWWPVGHNIGYGDAFINPLNDLVVAIRDKQCEQSKRKGAGGILRSPSF
jgi:hypothetical protein